MPRFAANLSWLFTEIPFQERFAAAAEAGFAGVEFLFPYAHAPAEVARWAREAGVEVVLFNLPPGSWANGDRGLAAQPGREDEFAASVEVALLYARALGTRRLHAMAGLVEPDVPRIAQHRCYLSNLRAAAARCAQEGVELLIEPINPFDMPHYYLTRVSDALDILDAVGSPNLRLQFDAYHVHRVGDEVLTQFGLARPRTAHVQIAGSPGRHEPGTGTFDCGRFLRQLDACHYDGWIGCEYRPQADTATGLCWRQILI